MPERLAGSRNHKPKGRCPWQPWKWEPPPKAAANWHHHTERISGNNLPDPYLPRYQPPKRRGREEARIRKDSLNTVQKDPLRSASSTAHAMQQYTIALQIPIGPPRKSRTDKQDTAGRIGLSLTLPKLYLAAFKRSNHLIHMFIRTKRNLHSHAEKAPLTTHHNQVTGYGDVSA